VLYLRARTIILRRGEILTLWAAIEQSIDAANSIAWELLGRTVSKVVPQSFRWKIQLFKALHKKVSPFYGLANMANAIILRLEVQKPLRDLMAHGLLHPNQPKWTFTPCLSAFHPHPLDVDLKAYPLCSHDVGM